MVARELRRLRGSLIIARHLWGQRGVAYQSRAHIEARRDAAVRAMVGYAVARVPYYRDLFQQRGWKAADIRGVAELRRLPLIDRSLVRQQPELFQPAEAVGRDDLLFTTSGSSGTPFAVRHDRTSVLSNVAYGERERQAVIALCGSGFRPKEVHIGYDTSNFKKVLRFYEECTRMPRPRRITIPMTAPIEDIVAAVNQHRPDVLTAYGSFVDLLFRSIAVRRLEMHRPKVVMYVGETLARERRREIEADFGVHVMSRYCAAEAFKIGYFCEQRTGFHIHEDLCDVRIIDANGNDLPAGEAGQIVISNLINRGTVLLNYPMGDVAAFATEACACGRNFQMLSELHGRVEDMLTLANGDHLHPRAIWAALKDETSLLQYQLVQHALDRFELRLRTADADSFAGTAERARRSLLALLGPAVQIACVHDPELGRQQRESTGKFRAVYSAL